MFESSGHKCKVNKSGEGQLGTLHLTLPEEYDRNRCRIVCNSTSIALIHIPGGDIMNVTFFKLSDGTRFGRPVLIKDLGINHEDILS